MSADRHQEITEDLFPGICENCEKILWNRDIWAGHQAAEYCDGGAVIGGLRGGIQS